jgi:hypothetical protein
MRLQRDTPTIGVNLGSRRRVAPKKVYAGTFAYCGSSDKELRLERIVSGTRPTDTRVQIRN